MKKPLAFLAALLLAVSLSACGETSVWQEPATVPQTNESLTVFCIGEGRHVNLIQTALDIYQKMHPDVEVELIRPLTEYSYSGDVPEQEAYDRLAVQIMGRGGPGRLHHRRFLYGRGEAGAPGTPGGYGTLL